jgi:hypothetical protein
MEAKKKAAMERLPLRPGSRDALPQRKAWVRRSDGSRNDGAGERSPAPSNVREM